MIQNILGLFESYGKFARAKAFSAILDIIEQEKLEFWETKIHGLFLKDMKNPDPFGLVVKAMFQGRTSYFPVFEVNEKSVFYEPPHSEVQQLPIKESDLYIQCFGDLFKLKGDFLCELPLNEQTPPQQQNAKLKLSLLSELKDVEEKLLQLSKKLEDL